MFRKQTQLPPEPNIISKKEIIDDLIISDDDCLYSGKLLLSSILFIFYHIWKIICLSMLKKKNY